MAISINGTSGISGVDGSAAIPALQGTDTNTGISFGTDIVDINAGGTTTIRTSPSSTQFKQSGLEGAELQLSDNDGTTFGSFIDVDGSGNLRVRTGGTNRNLYLGQVSGTGGITAFFTEGAERMRIDNSGNVLIGVTSAPSGSIGGSGFTPSSVGRFVLNLATTTTGGPTNLAQFINPNGTVGTITTNGSSTAFNTSSDYRLKENVVNLDGAISRVKQLSPKRFNFIADAETTVDGFLAHEAQAVVPEAVTGTHNEVDDDGNPVYQGIDQSKLVPLLTAALQEAIAKIETLEAKVAALEGGAS